MKTALVRYRVRPEFAETNNQNVQAVLAAHRELNDPDMRYAVFREDDTTFVHFGMYTDQAAVDRATDLPSFKAFQKALRDSEPLEPPKVLWLSAVGAGYDIFG